MKRKSLLFFLLMAMFAPLAMNGQTLVQVTSLEVGETYVIAKGNYAMGNTTYGSSGALTAVSFNSSDSPGDNILWTIESGNATNGYIFKNVGNNKYLGLNSNEYLDVVNSGTAMRYDGTDLINNVDSEGYYYVSLASNNSYFTTSKNTGQNIVMYKYTSDSGSSTTCEDFEGVTGTAYNTAGSMPSGWYSYTTATGTNIVAPHVTSGSSYNYYHSSSQSVNLESGTNATSTTGNYAYVVLPLYNNVSQLTYYSRRESTSYGTLKIGYVSAQSATGCNNFTEIATVTPTTTVTQYTIDFVNTYTLPAGKYLAFQWNTTGSYYACCIDDVCVTTSEASNLHVTAWTETDQHTAWGTVQIGNDTPGINVEAYVEEGTQITVTATPDECHTFAYWIPNGGGNNITQNPATITVNDDLDLQAVFTAITYNVTATPNNSSYGSVNGGGNNLECGSSCTLTATANTGYGFMGWQLNGNIVSTDNPYIITVNANAAYTAVFEQVSQHAITVTQAAGGTISANPTTAYMGDVITLTATPETGYFLVEWIVEDASHNPITVTNNQFTMPNSDVTVTATFTQGFTVTLNQTPNGTISADQTTNLQPGDIVTLTATPDNDCVFLAWYVYKTGSPRAVISVVNNSWFFMPSSDVTVQAVFVTEEQHDQTVGGGTATSTELPTNVYYNYSLSQQIYTAAELVYNGRITAIAFKANGSTTRTLDIYMAHTDKTAFSSQTDWEIMGSVAKVFTGSVSFSDSDWTTITLDEPFEYDGTSNLNICVADRTNSWVSRINFNTYATNADRALCISNDNDDFGANVGYGQTLAGYSGTLLTTNNQIKFTIKTPGSAESLTISPDAINDFSYVEGQGPSQTHKLDIVGVDLENNITLTAPTNFEISMTEEGTYGSSLSVPRETSKRGRNVTTWDFEGSMEGWTTIDADGDNRNWILGSASTEVYCASNPFANGAGYNGSSDGLVTASYSNYLGVLYPDNWIVSPQVTLGGSFSMWTKPYQVEFPNEHFGIYVSTSSDPTDLTSYIELNEWTMANTNWAQYSVDLSAFAGQTGYIAVRHFNCSDVYVMLADYFVLDTDAAITVEMPVTMTLETVFVRMKASLDRGNYSGTLTASAGTGDNVNGSVSLSGVVEAPSYNITLIANPIEGGNAEGGGTFPDGTSVTVTATTRGNYSFISWTENGTVVSTEASYTFTVTADRTLVANFGFIKHITGYGTGTGNWYLIASPIGNVDPANVTNMLSNSYDLFYFDDAKENEWVNYKDNESDEGNESTNPYFDLEKGKGYLYANSNDVDLVFTGAAHVGTNQDGTETVELAYTSGEGIDLPGWNLVGNPFAEIAYLAGNCAFYTMDSDGNFTSTTNASIEAMEGIFVEVSATGQTLTFTTEQQAKSPVLNLNLSNGRKVIDRAIVRFDGGNQMSKLQFRQGSTKVYIPVEGHDYAVVNSEEMGEMPVSFKAEENGTYTFSFNAEEVSFAYLHLIDNLTGNDVDLLETSSYSFEAKTTDYASRFKLVFATGNASDDTFAFFSNGSFVINNEGNAELQVIDIMGRIVKSESINGCANVSVNGAAGVYMLRLINGDNVKVQKVVVK